MFLRFVVTQKDQDSAKRQGLFVPAYALLNGGELPDGDQDRLQRAIKWFQANLIVPDKSTIKPRAIFWFKDSSRESVRRIWDVVDILTEHGYQVEFIKTEKPGYVIYEDDLQVCAIPFRDTVT